MEELIGKNMGRYKITELLGKGGMGAVFKAHDITLRRDVAIKVMLPAFARQSGFEGRFLQEARAAAQLDHPGIVQVFDFGQEQTRLYIVMKFIRGANLHQMLQDLKTRSKWLSLHESVELVRQVCLAIDYAHRQGVLHRDIKPSNIMLEPETSNGLSHRPVLTDLGLARLLKEQLVTQAESSGTPAYMSPEQVQGQPTDARSDVYSLGIILYELAVGHPPFPAKTLEQARHYHVQEPPPPPCAARPELPKQIEWLILKALEKDPDKRFANAAELAQALEAVLPAASRVDTNPTVRAGTVALETVYQESLVQSRGQSIVGQFQTPLDQEQDYVQFLEKGKITHSIPVQARVMTIGRGSDNDIVLDDPKVSRHHARIELNGTEYSITDLGSTNGTFLANQSLLPDSPEPWMPDKVLRIGKTWLRLARGEADQASATSRGTSVDSRQFHTSTDKRVGVFVDQDRLTVEPGHSASTLIVLLNQGTTVDHFHVSVVEGVPDEWVEPLPPRTELMPGLQQAVTLTIRPPRTSQSYARDYAITVRVTSESYPGQFADMTLTLTVGTYAQFNSELYPQKIQTGKSARVTVENQGNTQETFTLNWQDRAAELTFDPSQAELTIAAGERETVEFQACPQQRRWIGGEKVHPFNVQVATAKLNQSQGGEVVSTGLVPVWALSLLSFLCIALVTLTTFVYGETNKQYAQATQTAMAEEAATAAATLAVAQAGTATAEYWKRANQATVEAATATATWCEEDSDTDGLTNCEEKDEWGTDPHNKDSDGDTLLDGEEVDRYRTSPTNPDTDGDGQYDNVDPDPLRLPTPTPTPTHTPTPRPPTPTPPPPTVITPPLPSVSLEQAVRNYYSFIQQGQYDVAWKMEDKDRMDRMGMTSVYDYANDWEKSGPATIVGTIDIEENGDQAMITFRGHYSKYNVYHPLSFDLERDSGRGDQQFGYWVFVKGYTDNVGGYCPTDPPQRVRVGGRAQVCTRSDPLVVRQQPRETSSRAALIQTGTQVTILEGPICANGRSWWKVRIPSGVTGWVSEGSDHIDRYFICPL